MRENWFLCYQIQKRLWTRLLPFAKTEDSFLPAAIFTAVLQTHGITARSEQDLKTMLRTPGESVLFRRERTATRLTPIFSCIREYGKQAVTLPASQIRFLTARNVKCVTEQTSLSTTLIRKLMQTA